jgi:SPP1 gp7 family putative phage head morphogenesis protein
VSNHRSEFTARLIAAYRRIGAARRTVRRLPRQIPPRALSREYAARLLELVARMREALAPLLAELPRLLAISYAERRVDAARMDAGEGRRVRELIETVRRRLAESITLAEVEDLARGFAGRAVTWNGIQLGRQIKAALGIDLIGSETGLASLVEGFVDANVGLIRSIGDKLASDVEADALRAIQHGTRHEDLARTLEDRLGFAEDRAKLIARDQIGSLYGQVNATRQQQLGVERFAWRTVRDERVRSEHDDRDGQIYRYDDPPDGELPGEPVQCRCFAEPIFDDILGEIED